MVQRLTAPPPNEAGAAPGAAAGPGGVESLDDLAGLAKELQDGPQLEQQQEQEKENRAEIVSAAGEIAALLVFVRGLASPVVEGAGYLKPGQTQEIWTDKHLDTLATPLLIVMQRHGMGIGELMEAWGPYVMLAGALMLPTIATVKAVRENKAAREVEAGVKPAGTGDGATGDA